MMKTEEEKLRKRGGTSRQLAETLLPRELEKINFI